MKLQDLRQEENAIVVIHEGEVLVRYLWDDAATLKHAKENLVARLIEMGTSEKEAKALVRSIKASKEKS